MVKSNVGPTFFAGTATQSGLMRRLMSLREAREEKEHVRDSCPLYDDIREQFDDLSREEDLVEFFQVMLVVVMFFSRSNQIIVTMLHRDQLAFSSNNVLNTLRTNRHIHAVPNAGMLLLIIRTLMMIMS